MTYPLVSNASLQVRFLFFIPHHQLAIKYLYSQISSAGQSLKRFCILKLTNYFISSLFQYYSSDISVSFWIFIDLAGNIRWHLYFFSLPKSAHSLNHQLLSFWIQPILFYPDIILPSKCFSRLALRQVVTILIIAIFSILVFLNPCLTCFNSLLILHQNNLCNYSLNISLAFYYSWVMMKMSSQSQDFSRTDSCPFP